MDNPWQSISKFDNKLEFGSWSRPVMVRAVDAKGEFVEWMARRKTHYHEGFEWRLIRSTFFFRGARVFPTHFKELIPEEEE